MNKSTGYAFQLGEEIAFSNKKRNIEFKIPLLSSQQVAL